jgi:hypothetical protein
MLYRITTNAGGTIGGISPISGFNDYSWRDRSFWNANNFQYQPPYNASANDQ